MTDFDVNDVAIRLGEKLEDLTYPRIRLLKGAAVEYDLEAEPGDEGELESLVGVLRDYAVGRRSDTATARTAINELLHALFAVPYQEHLRVPDAFWASSPGRMVAAALVRLEGEQLIRPKEAAALSGRSVAVIYQAIQRGTLPSLPVWDTRWKRYGRLVRRDDVLALADGRREDAA